MRMTAVWLGLLSGICAFASPGRTEGKVDTIYANARVYTGDAAGSWAKAIAVADGKIVAVGSDEEIANHSEPGTAFRNLGGRMVMPGIHDTHLHPLEGGVQKKLQCTFQAESLERVLETLKECLEDLPAGTWLRGGQWNDGLFTPGASPKALLDAIAPDHPVFLMDWSVHNAWVNSRALREFGIDRTTADPVGGKIVRDENGDATGILLDNAAYEFRRQLPSYPLEDRVAALAWSLERVASYGVTTIKAALVTTPAMEAFAELRGRGKLALRVKTSLSWKSAWAQSHAAERSLMAERARYASTLR